MSFAMEHVVIEIAFVFSACWHEQLTSALTNVYFLGPVPLSSVQGFIFKDFFRQLLSFLEYLFICDAAVEEHLVS